jgi:drug/metabolite transporter (DMT)-like permease
VSVLIFVACVAIWSTNWLAITTQVSATPPLTSLFWRFTIAFVTLVAVERLRRKPDAECSVPLLASAAVGLLYYFGGVGLTYIAARHLPSAHLACLSVTVVFFSMAIKRIGYGTSIQSSNVIGAVISTAGLALFFLDGGGGGSTSLTGLAIGVASFLCVAIGAAISEFLQKRSRVSSLLINRNAIGCAALLYLVVALATHTSLAVPMTASYLGPLLYLAVVCSALVFVLFIELVGRLGVEYASYVTFIYPLAATYLSLVVGETTLRATMIAGSILVVVGCIVGLKYAKLATRVSSPLRSGGSP